MSHWALEVLVPAHRLVLALIPAPAPPGGGAASDEVVELRAGTSAGTFRAYRALPDAVHGMIAWPNTLLVTGPEPIVIDPGYQTQGDMLVGALARRGLTPADVGTVLATHLHSDHVSALPQLGEVDLFVHERELDTPHGRTGRGGRDDARVRTLTGDAGEIRPGIRWIHTPGHTDGHVAFLVDTAEGLVAVAGDTLGPDPGWFARSELPPSFPDRDAHLAAFARLRAERPVMVVPGHNPPQPPTEESP